MIDPPQNEDDVRKIVKDNGIEFLFAQFVDMHGKPSAKLVPAHHLDDLLTEGAGFAGFAAGDIGQGPDDPDMIAMPDPTTLTILPVAPHGRPLRLQRHRRGRGVAVLPAHDPAPRAGSGRRAGL